MDCYATLLEFKEDRDHLLSPNLNTVGIGLSYDKDKLVVVSVYSERAVTVEILSPLEESLTIYLEGKILQEKYGVFAIRIVVQEKNQNKTLAFVTPQDIFYDSNTKKWNCKFKNVSHVFQEMEKENLYVLVYLRDKPELIKYGEMFNGQIKFNDLKLGFRTQLYHFPHPYILKEQNLIDNEEKENAAKEIQKKKEEEAAERSEKNRRDNKKAKEGGGLEAVQEEPENDEEETDKTKSSIDHSKRDIKQREDKEKEDSIDIKDSLDGKREPYDEQIINLEKTLEQLKRENDEIQKNIALIFEFKKDSKDDKKLYKDSNINESTYHDTLTTIANLYNDLHTHRTKLNADLAKYEQSIKIQEERKKEVYKILMNYKEELLNNAEDRKGSKIPQKTKENWMAEELQYEEEIRKLRIENINSTLKLNRINKELKKTEEYFEGLHYIDFEQLKIENNVS